MSSWGYKGKACFLEPFSAASSVISPACKYLLTDIDIKLAVFFPPLDH